ncbi:TRAP-type C4-dicarboxylate transport system permease small subunit [Elusimicrobium posterum]|uniref:hypothetical protein n=1 Tax=Elusimicrobium posterum TaxID=3116653 RepID=UPI003C72B131
MARKILKLIISLLFLAAAAFAAVFALKNFMPELFESPKYGLKPVLYDSDYISKYGVVPAEPQNSPSPDATTKYGVRPLKK